jgi:hypothetical protein
VAIGGFASEVGKTTVLCNLLRGFPGWEAIKMTRGHYRSCGKDPHACCVSHLLSDEPVLRSGREQTYAIGKDTGRYWDAGATNVHWVIVTDDQVERGIRKALQRVRAPGVFIEGTSFTNFVEPDFMLMVARSDGGTIKAAARRALQRSSAIYISDPANDGPTARAKFSRWGRQSRVDELHGQFELLTHEDLPQLIARLREIHFNSAH